MIIFTLKNIKNCALNLFSTLPLVTESREKNSKLESLGKNTFLNTSVLRKNFVVNASVFRKKHLFFGIFRYFDKITVNLIWNSKPTSQAALMYAISVQ